MGSLSIVALGVFLLLFGLTAWVTLAILEAALASNCQSAPSPESARALGPLFAAVYQRPRQQMVLFTIAREGAVAVTACGAAVVGLTAGGVFEAVLLLLAIALTVAVLRPCACQVAAERSSGILQSMSRSCSLLLSPIDRVAASVSQVGRRIFGILRRQTPRGENIFAYDEIASLGNQGAAEDLEAPDRALLSKLSVFTSIQLRQIMTPRVDVFSLPVDTKPGELRQQLLANHYSRVPVYRGEPENIVGILYVKDLIGRHFDSGELEGILRKPYFVPATKTAGELFREFRKTRVHMAVVVDEYGGMAGIVTMEDLLEELFGEIRDEFDGTEEAIERRRPGSYLVSGRLPLTDFVSKLNLRVEPQENEATVAGLIVKRLGRIPEPGEVIPMDGFTLTVEAVEAHAIEKVRVDLWPLASS